jgi:glycosyltransferase involved in cell wall biosynthesis
MNSKTVLIFSNYDLMHPSGKGEVQVLMNTLRGFVSCGYRVVFATSAESSDRDDLVRQEFGENVEIMRFPGLFGAVKKLKQLVAGYFSQKPVSLSSRKRQLGSALDLEPGGLSDLLATVDYLFASLGVALRFLIEDSPDFLYGHQYKGALAAYIYSRLFGVPCVTRFMGTFFSDVLAHTDNGLEAFLRFPSWYLGLSVPADLIVMTDDGTRGRQALLALGQPEERIRFWVNGVRPQRGEILFKGEELLVSMIGEQRAQSSKVMLSISRLEPWKRIDRVITAMPRIIGACPEALLVVVGDGSDRAFLETMVEDLGIEGNVVFTGWLPHDEALALISQSHVVVSLYDYSNLTNQVLEALRYGKVVVTLDDDTTRGFLKDGYNARLVSLEMLHSELPEAVIEILTDDSIRQALERRAALSGEENLRTWHERMALEVSAIEEAACAR